MSTFYINPAAGNDANDGLSFANAWKTITSGATALRINPGDEIRIMESPAPTLVGTALWTNEFNTRSGNITGATNTTPIQITCANHGCANNDYVVITNVLGNTNANGIWQITNVSTNTFYLVGSTGNSNYINYGSFKNLNSNIVKLTSAATKDIVLTDNVGTVSSNGANWTASANVTSTINTTGWMPTRVSLAIGAGFTTGKAAYKTIPSTDFSAYQQISLQFSQTSGTLLAAGDVKICLCSDTLGAVIVDQFLVPAQPYLNTINIPITINKGSALGSAIQSIALYVVNDTGAITVLMSDIIAVKSTSSADNLSLTSMIGKNNDEYFLPILGIKNNIVFLFNGYAWTSLVTSYTSYYGTTETVNTYKIEPFYVLGALGDAGANINNSGTTGNYITFSGGWNRTNMSTQTSSTYFSGQGGLNANGIGVISKNYIDISKINLSKYSSGYSIDDSTYCNFYDSCISGCYTAISDETTSINIEIGGNSKKLTILFCVFGLYNNSSAYIVHDIFIASCDQCIYISIYEGNYYINNVTIKNCRDPIITSSIQYSYLLCNTFSVDSILNYNSIFNFYESNVIIKNLIISNSNSIGYCIQNGGSYILIYNLNISDSNFDILISDATSAPATVSLATINSGEITGSTFNFSDSIGYLNFSNVTGIPADIGTVSCKLLTFTNCVNTDLEVLNYFESAFDSVSVYKVSKNTSIYHGTTGTSWKLEQLGTSVNQYFPIQFSVARIAVRSNKLVTVSLWFKNSASTITGKLVCPGYQLNGTDVVATTTTSTNWQKLTITFTPTTEKVIEIFAYAYGDQNDYLYVSDMTITQAY
jgi:hypothetical protein